MALSYDGNTLAVGAVQPAGPGGAFIFVRSGSVWSEQAFLVGSPSATGQAQGSSVALSYDGNTVAIGAPGDNSSVGCVFIFVRLDGGSS